MIAEPDRVEADRLGGLGHADELRERDLPFDFRKLDSDEQRSSHGSTLASVLGQAERKNAVAYDGRSHT